MKRNLTYTHGLSHWVNLLICRSEEIKGKMAFQNRSQSTVQSFTWTAVAHITENDAMLEMVAVHVIGQFIPLIISLIISLAQI